MKTLARAERWLLPQAGHAVCTWPHSPPFPIGSCLGVEDTPEGEQSLLQWSWEEVARWKKEAKK